MATEEQIKELAYSIWEREGHLDGKAVEYFYRAKNLLEERVGVAVRATDLRSVSPLAHESTDPGRRRKVGETRTGRLRRLDLRRG
ncbi:MAG: DUF2934 domain-containing protein [Dehalococcoidia bacterium]|nr:DUF2934 domain-containing protein [Dehalococcoidia bacterium]